MFCLTGLCLSTAVFSTSMDQLILEDNLTSTGQKALDSIFGPGNFVLRVQVLLTESKYQVKYTQESNPKLSKKKSKATEKVYILPGVPAIKNISPDSFNQLPYDSVTTLVKPKVRKMRALLIARKNIPRREVRKAEKVIKDLLSFKDGRDTVQTTFKEFKDYGDAQQITIVPGEEKALTYQNLFYLILIICVLSFLILYAIYQKKRLEKEASESSAGSGVQSINVNPNIEMPEFGSGVGGGEMSLTSGPDIKRFFDFVTPRNIDNFILLLEKESLSLEQLTMVLSFLPSKLAAKILGRLPMEKQAAIASEIIDQQLCPRDELESLEAQFKSALECFIGGKSTFDKLFDQVPNASKHKMLSVLKKKNPTGFKKVRSNLVVFDDIKFLNDTDLKLVLSEANLEVLATALISVDQDLYQRVFSNLPETSKSMVAQYVELRRDETAEKEVEAAQDYLVKLVKKWSESGKIQLNRKA